MEMKQHNITQRDFNDEKIPEEKMKEPQQNVESGPSTINKCLNGNSIEVSKIIQKKGARCRGSILFIIPDISIK
jgi:hypothetical protein